MRHRRKGRHLGRNPSHRKALRRNLARSLFIHGRITTTVEKAKDLRPFAEKLITIARKDDLASFRRLISILDDKEIAKKLRDEIAPQYKDRPGGYTRILKLGLDRNRLGDNGERAIIELVEYTEASEAEEES